MHLSFLRRPLVAAVLVLSPAMLRAQIGASTACKDGTIARSGGAAACVGHGGVDDRRTASVRAVERSQRGAVAGKPGVATPRTAPRTGRTGSTASRSSGGFHLPRIGTRPTHPASGTPNIAAPGKSGSGSGGRLCKDGTVANGKGRNGNCGGHGGVAPHGARRDARLGRHQDRGRVEARGDRDDDDRGGEHGKGRGKGHGKKG